MSGHNRWSKLKRAKAVSGVAKGRLYSKLNREITMAVRLGGGDPDGNPRLRTALAAARDANMPAENIQRAVKKGTGELEGATYEEISYEGYGPGGVALLIECVTDNRNRSANDVRNILSNGGGNLAASGAVSWLFQKKGSIAVKPGPSEEWVLERAIEAGAEDVFPVDGNGFEVRTEPSALHAVSEALEREGLALEGRCLSYIPQNTIALDAEGEVARQLLRLLDALEENDDVQNVHSNVGFREGP